MARIAGTNIPTEKRVEIALTYIYGVGKTTAQKILSQLKIDPNTRVKSLTEDEINQLRRMVEDNFRVEGDLRREVLSNIKRLKETNSYKGTRHIKGLPVRGQRTKTNNRTVRGNKRVTAASGKKGPAQKT